METTTVALAPSATPGRIDVTAGDVLLGSVKDGGHLIRNAERLIKSARLLRSTGYDVDADRRLVATAYVL